MLPTDDANLSDARRVCRIIRCARGLTAGDIAHCLAATGPGLVRAVDARKVRRLIELARAVLGVPIVGEPGGVGYWIPANMEEAAGYIRQCRVMLLRYARLIAITRGQADLVAGEQFPLAEVAGEQFDQAAWELVSERVRAAVARTEQDIQHGG